MPGPGRYLALVGTHKIRASRSFRLRTVAPAFRIFDCPRAVEFYVGGLGFRIDWEDRPASGPEYLQVSRGDIVLHLSGHHGDGAPGAPARAEMRGLPAYHYQLLAKKYSYMRPALTPAAWNARVLEMDVLDPFGNRLVFCEPTGLRV